MNVTIAICTWNRAHLLRQTLRGLTEARVPRDLVWDVLVVDNNSTDDTPAIVAEYADVLPIGSVVERSAGVAHARNRALREARGDYIVWVDDDVLVARDWLAALVDAIRTYPEADGFGGPIEPWFPTRPDPDLLQVFPALAGGFCGLDHDRPMGPLAPGQYVWGANSAYRRSAIADKGFDVRLGNSPTSLAGGEETDLQNRVRAGGGVVIWCPLMSVRHYVIPERMALPYLRKFTREKGREQAIFHADESARIWFGAPPWLWAEFAAAAVKGALSHVVPRVGQPARFRSGPVCSEHASPRQRRLTWLREREFLNGMLQGTRGRVHVTSGSENEKSGTVAVSTPHAD